MCGGGAGRLRREGGEGRAGERRGRRRGRVRHAFHNDGTAHYEATWGVLPLARQRTLHAPGNAGWGTHSQLDARPNALHSLVTCNDSKRDCHHPALCPCDPGVVSARSPAGLASTTAVGPARTHLLVPHVCTPDALLHHLARLARQQRLRHAHDLDGQLLVGRDDQDLWAGWGPYYI